MYIARAMLKKVSVIFSLYIQNDTFFSLYFFSGKQTLL